MRKFNKNLNTQFFYDRVVSNGKVSQDLNRISENFFLQGEKISLPKSEKINISGDFSYDKQNDIYHLNVSGYVYQSEYAVTLLPLLYISPKKIKCLAIVPVKPLSPSSLEEEIILEELEDHNFSIENLNLKEMSQKIVLCYLKEQGGVVSVCEGIEPIPAIPDSLKILESEETDHLIKLQDSLGKDFLFFEELKFLKKVNKGEIVGQYSPRVEGVPGVDIFGDKVDYLETVLTKIGRGLKILPGQDVVAEYDGFLKIGIGRIYQIRNTKLIEDSLEADLILKEDVDVLIRKNIAPGVRLKAQGNVNILGNVEGAIIECGGELTVAGGTIRNAQVSAQKDIEMQFVSSSSVEAGRNVRVKKYILDSRIKAGDHILVKFPKAGHIAGGEIILGRSLEVNMLGAPSGKKTHINIVNMKRESKIAYDKIMERLEECDKFLNKINTALGPLFLANPSDYIKKLSEEKRKKIMPIVLKLKNTLDEKKEIQKEKEVIVEKRKNEKKALKNETFIVVNEEVYDNVIIIINKLKYQTTETTSFSCIFQEESGTIVRKPLEMTNSF